MLAFLKLAYLYWLVGFLLPAPLLLSLSVIDNSVPVGKECISFLFWPLSLKMYLEKVVK